MKITKKSKFKELLEKYPKAAEMLAAKGMYCIGCPMALEETLEEGIKAHGLDVDKIIDELNKELEKDERKK